MSGHTGWSRPTQQARARAPLAQHRDDFYETPRVAIDKLLAVEKFGPAIWEPSAGCGAISRVLREKGHRVIDSDLVDRPGCGCGRVDFLLTWQLPEKGVDVCTNPPYALSTEFASHACDLVLRDGGKVALLLRLAFLAGQRRRDGLFKQYPSARILIHSQRLPMMHRDGWAGPRASSSVDHCWLIWDAAHRGRPEIIWL